MSEIVKNYERKIENTAHRIEDSEEKECQARVQQLKSNYEALYKQKIQELEQEYQQKVASQAELIKNPENKIHTQEDLITAEDKQITHLKAQYNTKARETKETTAEKTETIAPTIPVAPAQINIIKAQPAPTQAPKNGTARRISKRLFIAIVFLALPALLALIGLAYITFIAIPPTEITIDTTPEPITKETTPEVNTTETTPINTDTLIPVEKIIQREELDQYVNSPELPLPGISLIEYNPCVSSPSNLGSLSIFENCAILILLAFC